jgi:hypothetical protein
MTEKTRNVNEVRYYKENLAYLKRMFAHYGKYIPGNEEDESKVKRIADIDLAIIYLMYEDAFYNEDFHFWDQKLITQKLMLFRPDLNITDKEISEALKRNTDKKRLYGHGFVNGTVIVNKWKYNESYKQPPEKSSSGSQKPPSNVSSSGEKNPFESEDYKKLKDELDKL